MQIGELAIATGLSRDTLRFYEKRGLLRARRLDNGYRDYPEQAVQWLCYLRSAQALGFTLAEIETGLPTLTAPDAEATVDLRAALRRKLDDVDARIAALHTLRTALAQQLADDAPLACLSAADIVL